MYAGRVACCPWWATVSMPMGQTDRRTDARPLRLRFLLDASSITILAINCSFVVLDSSDVLLYVWTTICTNGECCCISATQYSEYIYIAIVGVYRVWTQRTGCRAISDEPWLLVRELTNIRINLQTTNILIISGRTMQRHFVSLGPYTADALRCVVVLCGAASASDVNFDCKLWFLILEKKLLCKQSC